MQQTLNRRLAFLLPLYFLACTATACCVSSGLAAPLEWAQHLGPTLDFLAGLVNLGIPLEPWLDENHALIKARFPVNQTYVYDVDENSVRSSNYSYYDPPEGIACKRPRYQAGPGLRLSIERALARNNLKFIEICVSPNGERVLVLATSTLPNSSGDELYIFDNRGQVVNHFDKFDFVRATYWGLPLIDLNI